MNILIVISILLNIGFFSSFLSRYILLRKAIKRQSYTSGVFRGIDELRRETFLKLSIFGGFNLMVLIITLYEINH